MSALKSLILTGVMILALMASVAGFNYSVDANCYYSCDDVEKNRNSINTYYRTAQRVLAFPEADTVIMGSSRGETTPPQFFDQAGGGLALNLSTAGAEFATKKALLHVALEKLKVKRVIWLADYFELIEENQDAKIKKTPALRRYLGSQAGAGPERGKSWSQKIQTSSTDFFESIQGLVDHNTTSASIRFFKKPPRLEADRGGVGELNPQTCASESYVGPETPQSLQAKINVIYQNQVQQVLKSAPSERAGQEFKDEMQALAERGIEVFIVIAPYHPEFVARLQRDKPEIYAHHLDWVKSLRTLSAPRIQVIDYFSGIPGDDGSNKYWNDGVHYTCHSAVKMLQKTL